MTSDTMTVEAVGFSFLTAGPGYQMELPQRFDRLPELSSPVNFYETGGARYVDFLPAARDSGITEKHRALGVLPGRDGRMVEVFERIGSPAQWYLRWPLQGGPFTRTFGRRTGCRMRRSSRPTWVSLMILTVELLPCFPRARYHAALLLGRVIRSSQCSAPARQKA